MSLQTLKRLLPGKIVVITTKNCKWTGKTVLYSGCVHPQYIGYKKLFFWKWRWMKHVAWYSAMVNNAQSFCIYLYLSSCPSFLPYFVFFSVIPPAIVLRYRAGNFMNNILLGHILSHLNPVCITVSFCKVHFSTIHLS